MRDRQAKAQPCFMPLTMKGDRKSTRLNSSHSQISYAVFCLNKKTPTHQDRDDSCLCTGTRDSVNVWAVVEPSRDTDTGRPEDAGPGHVRHPRRPMSSPSMS